MKAFLKILAGPGAILALLVLLSCVKVTNPGTGQSQEEQKQEEPQMPDKIQITIDGKTLPVVLEKNEATKALVAALQVAPITYIASDYGGFEKVGPLGRSLPTNNSQITTQAGDVILYSGNQIVLFYGSNTWSYTRLGKIDLSSMDELKTFLKAGEGDIDVTLSL